ncbi:unnamed protein product [Paramecium primaurelia]|uniref:Uncharacterized protein n=1 Tax=Paramecium primaurelia TaxID=5886 RepID=A0A8S1PNI0_PARPR|nr:unnamed protein product [Paramecium primaurelia]
MEIIYSQYITLMNQHYQQEESLIDLNNLLKDDRARLVGIWFKYTPQCIIQQVGLVAIIYSKCFHYQSVTETLSKCLEQICDDYLDPESKTILKFVAFHVQDGKQQSFIQIILLSLKKYIRIHIIKDNSNLLRIKQTLYSLKKIKQNKYWRQSNFMFKYVDIQLYKIQIYCKQIIVDLANFLNLYYFRCLKMPYQIPNFEQSFLITLYLILLTQDQTQQESQIIRLQ